MDPPQWRAVGHGGLAWERASRNPFAACHFVGSHRKSSAPWAAHPSKLPAVAWLASNAVTATCAYSPHKSRTSAWRPASSGHAADRGRAILTDQDALGCRTWYLLGCDAPVWRLWDVERWGCGVGVGCGCMRAWICGCAGVCGRTRARGSVRARLRVVGQRVSREARGVGTRVGRGWVVGCPLKKNPW